MHIDYIMRRVSPAAWLILLAVNGSCFTRYAVDYTLSTRSIGPENQQNELQFPPPNALDVLSEAKTVAFAPPDDCLEASEGKDIARQRCGEVMTALEQAASASGLQVLSWQAIRGNEPALSYARRSNVDILFEINRLGPDDSLNDYTHWITQLLPGAVGRDTPAAGGIRRGGGSMPQQLAGQCGATRQAEQRCPGHEHDLGANRPRRVELSPSLSQLLTDCRHQGNRLLRWDGAPECQQEAAQKSRIDHVIDDQFQRALNAIVLLAGCRIRE